MGGGYCCELDLSKGMTFMGCARNSSLEYIEWNDRTCPRRLSASNDPTSFFKSSQAFDPNHFRTRIERRVIGTSVLLLFLESSVLENVVAIRN